MAASTKTRRVKIAEKIVVATVSELKALATAAASKAEGGATAALM